ncbi:MAG: sensor histidine kinase [Trueperaceae bacterium]|nr:sensor histidine kinase [Trueperaceae bacterium]
MAAPRASTSRRATVDPDGSGGGAPWWRVVSPRRLGWEPYINLVWLTFLVFQPIFDPGATALDWVIVAALVALFLPIYLWTWARRGEAALPGIVALAVLGFAAAPLNTGATGFLIYASAAAGLKLPPRRATWAIAAMTAAVIIAAVVSSVPWPYVLAAFMPALLFVPLIGALNGMYGVRIRAAERLQRAHDEIERISAIAERERIGRDLHDLLGHTLSVIILKSELASKLADTEPTRAASEIRDVERISRRALGEVREAVGRYRQRGLLAEIEEARSAFDSAGVRLEIDLPGGTPPPRLEGALALVLREALTNVLRHAEASRCGVRLALEGRVWVLEVVDDGIGRLTSTGTGLSGVRERVEGLGGSLELAGGDGVRLVARIPARTPA